jgi:hypothetical protein
LKPAAPTVKTTAPAAAPVEEAKPPVAASSPAAPTAGNDELPVIDAAALMQYYLTRRFDLLAKVFRDVLEYYFRHPFDRVTPETEKHINLFAENFLYFITKPDFLIPNELTIYFVTFNPIIGNLIAVSEYRTTDPQISLLLRQPNNFVKLLMLYSPRNKHFVDFKVLFDKEPTLASIWYTVYTLNVAGWSSELLYDNGRRHILGADDRLEARDENVAHPYFACTYIDPDRDRLVKSQLNRSIQRKWADVRIANRPRRDSIAILTGKWFSRSAVYRSAYPLIATLKERYRLTLVHFGENTLGMDLSLFEDVRCVEMKAGQMDLSPLQNNDFQMAYFPDVGMTGESIWLSNLRIAPIQVVSYGHPVSTYGSRIDYFIGGQQTELREKVMDYYTERMVLIPGLGAHPTYPDYVPRHPDRPTDAIHINCPWGFTKINYPWLMKLREIQQRAKKPVKFQFLPGGGASKFGSVIPLTRDLGEALPGAAIFYSNRGYAEYMQAMELAELAIESHPFGGYNTIVDQLHLGIPIVTREGTRFYNRAASGLLRKVGLDELVATSDEEYVEKVIRLIDDDDYRHALSERIKGMNLREMVYDTDEPKYFRKAIDYLIDNWETLRNDASRQPIYIN